MIYRHSLATGDRVYEGGIYVYFVHIDDGTPRLLRDVPVVYPHCHQACNLQAWLQWATAP